MSIVHIKAQISCDGCGTNFIVSLEPSRMRPKGWSLEDEAVDVVRGGGPVEVPRGGRRVEGECSVQHDFCLCASCTEIVDKHTPDPNTKAQVRRALNRYVTNAAVAV